jgi:hypothetical protein
VRSKRINIHPSCNSCTYIWNTLFEWPNTNLTRILFEWLNNEICREVLWRHDQHGDPDISLEDWSLLRESPMPHFLPNTNAMVWIAITDVYRLVLVVVIFMYITLLLFWRLGFDN